MNQPLRSCLSNIFANYKGKIIYLQYWELPHTSFSLVFIPIPLVYDGIVLLMAEVLQVFVIIT